VQQQQKQQQLIATVLGQLKGCELFTTAATPAPKSHSILSAFPLLFTFFRLQGYNGCYRSTLPTFQFSMWLSIITVCF